MASSLSHDNQQYTLAVQVLSKTGTAHTAVHVSWYRGVEWRHADEAVDAGLVLEPTVGIGAAHEQRGMLDASGHLGAALVHRRC